MSTRAFHRTLAGQWLDDQGNVQNEFVFFFNQVGRPMMVVMSLLLFQTPLAIIDQENRELIRTVSAEEIRTLWSIAETMPRDQMAFSFFFSRDTGPIFRWRWWR